MKLIHWLFPEKGLMKPTDDMTESLEYYKRMSRGRIEVDSEVSAAKEMKLVASAGKFIGYGNHIKEVSLFTY
jgi:hypothetical protein